MAKYAVIVAAGVALLVTALLGFVVVPFLRKLHFGQTINEIGPKWHKEKQGTPTMGGFLFIIGSTVGLLLSAPIIIANITENAWGNMNVLVLGVVTTLAFSVVGFIDDFLKVVKKRNLGLLAWQKMIMQSVITASFLVSLHMMGRLSTWLTLPFVGTVDLGVFFYPLAFVFIVGIVNAVNLTDGLDGLASSVTLWVMCGYLVIATISGENLLALWVAALAGGCGGFLVWNFYPAKVFMGDTGSMFLGGAVAVLGFCMGKPEITFILGLVYIIEALTVMIQVTYFKITKGKRLFKMTPIHHHFEMMGWSEVKIVSMFSVVALVCALLACLYVLMVY